MQTCWNSIRFLSQDEILNVMCVVWWVLRAHNQILRTQASSDWQGVSSNFDSRKCTTSSQRSRRLFSNKKNETNYISLLRMHRHDVDHHVEGSSGQAHTIIVSSALEFARNGQTVTFVPEDTAVLIMLVYHWRNCMEDIFIRT